MVCTVFHHLFIFPVLLPEGLTRTLCVLFSLQFRLFGSGQTSGQGDSGLLHPGGDSLRRTPRRSKKLFCVIWIFTCCFTRVVSKPPEEKWVAPGENSPSFTMKLHKQQMWCYLRKRAIRIVLITCHLVTVIITKSSNLFIATDCKEMNVYIYWACRLKKC